MLKVLLILSLLCIVAHSNIIVRGRGLDDSGSTAGESKGSWVLLGSMCFDAKTEDELTIVATGLAEGSNQRILFYDDESGSFANAVGAKSCAEKVKHAKQLSYVDNIASIKYNHSVILLSISLLRVSTFFSRITHYS